MSARMSPVPWVIWMKPSSRSASTRAKFRMSSSHMMSVTMGEPSKSACTLSGPRRWMEKPQSPASMPSCRSRAISLRSFSEAGSPALAFSRPMT